MLLFKREFECFTKRSKLVREKWKPRCVVPRLSLFWSVWSDLMIYDKGVLKLTTQLYSLLDSSDCDTINAVQHHQTSSGVSYLSVLPFLKWDYSNYLCFIYDLNTATVDHSRVLIKEENQNEPGHDYINANYIDVSWLLFWLVWFLEDGVKALLHCATCLAILPRNWLHQ